MAPYIADEWEPDFHAAKLFEEHLHDLEMQEYYAECARDFYLDEDEE